VLIRLSNINEQTSAKSRKSEHLRPTSHGSAREVGGTGRPMAKVRALLFRSKRSDAVYLRSKSNRVRPVLESNFVAGLAVGLGNVERDVLLVNLYLAARE